MDEYEWTLQLIEENIARLVSRLIELSKRVDISLTEYSRNRAMIVAQINYLKRRIDAKVQTRKPFQEKSFSTSKDIA